MAAIDGFVVIHHQWRGYSGAVTHVNLSVGAVSRDSANPVPNQITFDIDWGDGTSQSDALWNYFDTAGNLQRPTDPSHTYSTPGPHTITVSSRYITDPAQVTIGVNVVTLRAVPSSMSSLAQVVYLPADTPPPGSPPAGWTDIPVRFRGIAVNDGKQYAYWKDSVTVNDPNDAAVTFQTADLPSGVTLPASPVSIPWVGLTSDTYYIDYGQMYVGQGLVSPVPAGATEFILLIKVVRDVSYPVQIDPLPTVHAVGHTASPARSDSGVLFGEDGGGVGSFFPCSGNSGMMNLMGYGYTTSSHPKSFQPANPDVGKYWTGDPNHYVILPEWAWLRFAADPSDPSGNDPAPPPTDTFGNALDPSFIGETLLAIPAVNVDDPSFALSSAVLGDTHRLLRIWPTDQFIVSDVVLRVKVDTTPPPTPTLPARSSGRSSYVTFE